jgi:hypothetical protein
MAAIAAIAAIQASTYSQVEVDDKIALAIRDTNASLAKLTTATDMLSKDTTTGSVTIFSRAAPG